MQIYYFFQNEYTNKWDKTKIDENENFIIVNFLKIKNY